MKLNDGSSYPYGVGIALKPRDQWTNAHNREELVAKMSAALEERAPDGSFGVTQPIGLRIAELIYGVRSDVAIKLFGDDLDLFKREAGKIVSVAGKVRGAEVGILRHRM
jgi:heavy metal efflux system protein